VPADHDGCRYPFGTAIAALGYVIERGRSVYFAGDTGLFEGMRELSPELDLALLPVWGWGPKLGPGHLGPREAADALRLLRPRRAVPIHWGTLFPRGLRRDRERLLRDPPHEFARAAVELAPDVDVSVLAPGESLELGR
jgi:L-ascorbate metabolism protein UlaG (beta-lactamase superfamily)